MGNRQSHRGFTLVEVLTVVAIIAILATLVVTVSGRAFRSADRTRLGYQLQMVEQALEAYKTDFGSLPITQPDVAGIAGDDITNEAGYRGARMLCKALMGPVPQGDFASPTFAATPNHDGAEGFGFRVPPRSGVFRSSGNTLASGANEMAGKTYGPYLNPSQFHVSNTYSPKGTAAQAPKINGDLVDPPTSAYDDSAVLLDANGHPILYYPVLNSQPPMNLADAYVGRGTNEGATGNAYAGLPMFRSADNDAWLAPTVLRKQLGCGPAKQYGTDPGSFNPTQTAPADNRTVDSGETPAVKGKYILWSAGPDGIFGPDLNSKKPNDLDDVTNVENQ